MAMTEVIRADAVEGLRVQPSAEAGGLPVPVSPGIPLQVGPRTRRPSRRIAMLLLPLIGIAAAAGWWWMQPGAAVPPGIAWSNGRLEADEIDIATKFAGRVAEVMVDEGDMVHAGQVVARMDTRDFEAQLAQAQAGVQQAGHNVTASRAALDQQRTVLILAAQELQRSLSLLPKGFETRQVADQRQQALNGATAGFQAAQAKQDMATAELDAARRNAELIGINIADDTLVTPKDGRIQYRLANVGQVLGAGGKVFTTLDTGYVYMDIFLSTAQAGRVAAGTEARILLDAWPARPLPARVMFVDAQNQFTPKAVETKSERDKLMFRVRVRIDPGLLRANAEKVRSGLPGLAYVKVDQAAQWPLFLQLPAGS